MELWIRSQNKKTLVKAEHLDIYDCTLEDDLEGHWWIEESGTDLGEYKSKERALEVLDEIQTILKENNAWVKTNGLGKTLDIVPRNVEVYQMPEE